MHPHDDQFLGLQGDDLLRMLKAFPLIFGQRERDVEAVEEITQEALVIACKNQDRYRPDKGEPLSWLLGIAGNVSRRRKPNDATRGRSGPSPVTSIRSRTRKLSTGPGTGPTSPGWLRGSARRTAASSNWSLRAAPTRRSRRSWGSSRGPCGQDVAGPTTRSGDSSEPAIRIAAGDSRYTGERPQVAWVETGLCNATSAY
jgi:hypothetical protein